MRKSVMQFNHRFNYLALFILIQSPVRMSGLGPVARAKNFRKFLRIFCCFTSVKISLHNALNTLTYAQNQLENYIYLHRILPRIPQHAPLSLLILFRSYVIVLLIKVDLT